MDQHGDEEAAEHKQRTLTARTIWTCADAELYADNIERGVAFLTSLSANGGIRYQVGSDDINTWATIFGAQAIDWANDGGQWQCLI